MSGLASVCATLAPSPGAISGGPTLVYLRRIGAKVGRVLENLRDPLHPNTSLEGQPADLRGHLNNLAHRMDRLDVRLGCIERRLDIADAPA